MNEEEQQKLTHSCMEELQELLKTPFRNPETVLTTLVAGMMITCTCKDRVSAEGARKVISLVMANHPRGIEMLGLMTKLVGGK